MYTFWGNGSAYWEHLVSRLDRLDVHGRLDVVMHAFDSRLRQVDLCSGSARLYRLGLKTVRKCA